MGEAVLMVAKASAQVDDTAHDARDQLVRLRE